MTNDFKVFWWYLNTLFFAGAVLSAGLMIYIGLFTMLYDKADGHSLDFGNIFQLLLALSIIYPGWLFFPLRNKIKNSEISTGKYFATIAITFLWFTGIVVSMFIFL